MQSYLFFDFLQNKKGRKGFFHLFVWFLLWKSGKCLHLQTIYSFLLLQSHYNPMMKTIKILVAGFMFAALVACDKLSNLIDQAYGGVDLAELDSLQAQDSEKMSVMLEAVALSLDSIQKQEEELYQLDESTPRDVMLSQLRTLRDMLDRKKAEIDQLTADSISEGKTIANLRKVLEYLSLQLEEKSENLAKYEEAVKNSEAKIAKLRDKVDVLTVESGNLKAQNDEQEKRLNEVYYIVGSKSELKNLGLLSGNVLGKKRANYSNINNKEFHQVDARTFTTLVINSKSPKLLTEKPESSYTLTKNDDGTSTLKITNAKAFWESSPYLIVMQ